MRTRCGQCRRFRARSGRCRRCGSSNRLVEVTLVDDLGISSGGVGLRTGSTIRWRYLLLSLFIDLMLSLLGLLSPLLAVITFVAALVPAVLIPTVRLRASAHLLEDGTRLTEPNGTT